MSMWLPSENKSHNEVIINLVRRQRIKRAISAAAAEEAVDLMHHAGPANAKYWWIFQLGPLNSAPPVCCFRKSLLYNSLSFAWRSTVRPVKHLCAALSFWVLRFSILPKDTSACRTGKTGIEPPTFLLLDNLIVRKTLLRYVSNLCLNLCLGSSLGHFLAHHWFLCYPTIPNPYHPKHTLTNTHKLKCHANILYAHGPLFVSKIKMWDQECEETGPHGFAVWVNK